MVSTLQMNWQPIETAPGYEELIHTKVILGNPVWPESEVGERTKDGTWLIHNGNKYRWGCPEPTHWQPLPQAPETHS